jgi:D-tagatose-1,6-bisphosphate aldolase subunit GatZ/KbaZ
VDSWLAQLRARHLQDGEGMFAVCSAHSMVLRCALQVARERDRPLLIEATANQVNPFNGYSGMTPADFTAFISRGAGSIGIPESRIMIGADHLGPHVWKREPAAAAMEKAAILARQCIRAGFHKIHIDTVQGCADDPHALLCLEQTARRAAQLCRSAETAAREQPRRPPPVYVIGNEVPPPGGGLEAGDDAVTLTDAGQIRRTLDAYEQAFDAAGVASAWPRVMAIVVQPGVEFGDERIVAYRSERAAALSDVHARLPGIMTYEIHATDYQSPQALQQMVRDHFALLKVGPCLTFAMREALYALADLEAALGPTTPSRLPLVMEKLMNAHPQHWQSHYKGSPETQQRLRHHSLRDRIRYYWSHPDARQAVERLMRNLNRPVPDALLEQYLPESYPHAPDRRGARFDPAAFVQARIRQALQPYVDACWGP